MHTCTRTHPHTHTFSWIFQKFIMKQNGKRPLSNTMSLKINQWSCAKKQGVSISKSKQSCLRESRFSAICSLIYISSTNTKTRFHRKKWNLVLLCLFSLQTSIRTGRWADFPHIELDFSLHTALIFACNLVFLYYMHHFFWFVF